MHDGVSLTVGNSTSLVTGTVLLPWVAPMFNMGAVVALGMGSGTR